MNPVQNEKLLGFGGNDGCWFKVQPWCELFVPWLHHQLLAALSCPVYLACLLAPGVVKAALVLHGFATLWVHPSSSEAY